MGRPLPLSNSSKTRSELQKRILSSLILTPLALGAIYMGGWFYAIFVTAFVLMALYEWRKFSVAIKTTTAAARVMWFAAGLPYVVGGGAALVYLRQIPDIGFVLTLFLMLAVWGTDVGAYAVGRLIGGSRLAPKISPNKTWAGFFGGVVFACLLGYAVTAIYKFPAVAPGLFMASILSVVAQLGDLFESYAKRRAGVKDSGHVIPGHGGVLDRIDGLLFAAVFLALFYVMAGYKLMW
jgi:phosphatidate cytidylyltransferase